jgi:formamidopyrimidine-DNA glycosylase
MVEGHGVKRVCERHKRLLLNKLFKCDSPNGRFTEGAKRIDNKILYRIESIGKNLFYFFRGERNIKESSTVVHIHFGMSGRFYNSNLASLPKCTPTTRLRMVNKKANIGALLSAMTCVAGPLSLYEQKKMRLGQDPLRHDADKNTFFGCTIFGTNAQRRAHIGDVLMDQQKLAGVGNIYRAEICYKARLHPLTKVSSLSVLEMDKVWYHSVDLLQRGFLQGSILTVDEVDKSLPSYDGRRRYIYNQSVCLCGGVVRSFTMKGRNCYVCEACQRLPAEDLETAQTPTRPVKLFRSLCAPDALKLTEPEKYSVKELTRILSKLNMVTTGKKADLVQRLKGIFGHGSEDLNEASCHKIEVGVGHLSEMVSAEDALKEKIKAAEKRNVEHVALVDEDSSAHLIQEASKKRRRRVSHGRKSSSRKKK